MKFYSPLTADFFPNEPDYEDEFYDEYEGYPQDGHELLEYETAIRDAVENDTRDFGGDLMQYYHEDDSVRNKVVTAIPSVEVHGNKLCGCLTVELKEPLPYETIVKAHEGDPDAIDTILSHYAGYIRYCSKVHGKVNAEVEEHIKQQLIAALFKFRFDR